MAPTEEFWTKTYQRSIAKLTGICYRYTRNYQLSEDLAHEGFLKAIEKREGFRGDGNFDAWLQKIVVNHVLQHLRDQKKHPFVQQLSPEAAAIDAQDNTVAQPMEFSFEELLQTIEKLPDHHRLVFNLYVIEKFSHAEIGNELGISEGTSKSHLARARKKLKHLLTEKVNTERDKGNSERAAVLLMALSDDADTDRLFIEGFERFAVKPQADLPLHFAERSSTKLIGSSKWPVKMISVVSMGVITTVSIFLLVSGPRKDAALTKIPTDSTTITENIPLPPATILRDNVSTGRNKKLKTMKPLDSLAFVLALASATVDTSARDSIRDVIENAHTDIAFADTIPPANSAKPAVLPDAPAEKGSFRASELVWSRENHELSFKGSVRVNFRDQHFQGKGSFNVLGAVYLLIVDGEKIALGKSVKLSKRDYHLSVLTKDEAIATYGPSGDNGAVVITASL